MERLTLPPGLPPPARGDLVLTLDNLEWTIPDKPNHMHDDDDDDDDATAQNTTLALRWWGQPQPPQQFTLDNQGCVSVEYDLVCEAPQLTRYLLDMRELVLELLTPTRHAYAYLHLGLARIGEGVPFCETLAAYSADGDELGRLRVTLEARFYDAPPLAAPPVRPAAGGALAASWHGRDVSTSFTLNEQRALHDDSLPLYPPSPPAVATATLSGIATPNARAAPASPPASRSPPTAATTPPAAPLESASAARDEEVPQHETAFEGVSLEDVFPPRNGPDEGGDDRPARAEKPRARRALHRRTRSSSRPPPPAPHFDEDEGSRDLLESAASILDRAQDLRRRMARSALSIEALPMERHRSSREQPLPASVEDRPEVDDDLLEELFFSPKPSAHETVVETAVAKALDRAVESPPTSIASAEPAAVAAVPPPLLPVAKPSPQAGPSAAAEPGAEQLSTGLEAALTNDTLVSAPAASMPTTVPTNVALALRLASEAAAVKQDIIALLEVHGANFDATAGGAIALNTYVSCRLCPLLLGDGPQHRDGVLGAWTIHGTYARRQLRSHVCWGEASPRYNLAHVALAGDAAATADAISEDLVLEVWSIAPGTHAEELVGLARCQLQLGHGLRDRMLATVAVDGSQALVDPFTDEYRGHVEVKLSVGTAEQLQYSLTLTQAVTTIQRAIRASLHGRGGVPRASTAPVAKNPELAAVPMWLDADELMLASWDESSSESEPSEEAEELSAARAHASRLRTAREMHRRERRATDETHDIAVRVEAPEGEAAGGMVARVVAAAAEKAEIAAAVAAEHWHLALRVSRATSLELGAELKSGSVYVHYRLFDEDGGTAAAPTLVGNTDVVRVSTAPSFAHERLFALSTPLAEPDFLSFVEAQTAEIELWHLPHGAPSDDVFSHRLLATASAPLSASARGNFTECTLRPCARLVAHGGTITVGMRLSRNPCATPLELPALVGQEPLAAVAAPAAPAAAADEEPWVHVEAPLSAALPPPPRPDLPHAPRTVVTVRVSRVFLPPALEAGGQYMVRLLAPGVPARDSQPCGGVLTPNDGGGVAELTIDVSAQRVVYAFGDGTAESGAPLQAEVQLRRCTIGDASILIGCAFVPLVEDCADESACARMHPLLLMGVSSAPNTGGSVKVEVTRREIASSEEPSEALLLDEAGASAEPRAEEDALASLDTCVPDEAEPWSRHDGWTPMKDLSHCMLELDAAMTALVATDGEAEADMDTEKVACEVPSQALDDAVKWLPSPPCADADCAAAAGEGEAKAARKLSFDELKEPQTDLRSKASRRAAELMLSPERINQISRVLHAP